MNFNIVGNLANFKIIDNDFCAFYSGGRESFRPLNNRWEFTNRSVNMLQVKLVVRLNQQSNVYELIHHMSGEYPEMQLSHS